MSSEDGEQEQPAGDRRDRSAPSRPIWVHDLAAQLSRNGQGDAPLHRQVERCLRGFIRDGRIDVGTLLPSEQELAAALGISRSTVRQALGTLTQEGLLHRRRHAGTVVSATQARQPFQRGLGAFYAFAWEMRERGASHHSVVLERTSLAASDDLAEQLHLTPGAPVERIVRLRSAEGEPLILETRMLPLALAALLDQRALEHEAVYDVLERVGGVAISRAHETLRPIVLDERTAQLLGVSAGSAAFQVERVTWAGKQPIEWQQSIVRGDRYLYAVDLPRRRNATNSKRSDE